MKIGFTYNIKDTAFDSTDHHAEYETTETISELRDVLALFGEVVCMECNPELPAKLIEKKPDVMFNIAEGWGGRDRESFVPALCAMLGIPCTGSDAAAMAVTMDKALTKRISRDSGVRTTEFVLSNGSAIKELPFDFPVFVKPAWDGSSRGIYSHSLVKNMRELHTANNEIHLKYSQPSIIEPYLAGRDFCIALIGNPPACLSPCEVLLGHEEGIPFFSWEYKMKETDILEIPPSISTETIEEMSAMSLTVWEVIGCLDYARVDFRTGSDGLPYLLEVNALPGLSRKSGIFTRQALASGMTYERMIETILARAACL